MYTKEELVGDRGLDPVVAFQVGAEQLFSNHEKEEGANAQKHGGHIRLGNGRANVVDGLGNWRIFNKKITIILKLIV